MFSFLLYLIVQDFLAQIEQNWTLNVVHSSKKQNQYKWYVTSLYLNNILWWKYNQPETGKNQYIWCCLTLNYGSCSFNNDEFCWAHIENQTFVDQLF